MADRLPHYCRVEDHPGDQCQIQAPSSPALPIAGSRLRQSESGLTFIFTQQFREWVSRNTVGDQAKEHRQHHDHTYKKETLSTA